MRSQVEAATSDLLGRLSRVGEVQDEMRDKQEEMDDTLRDVSGRVEAVQDGVVTLQHQVAYSNHAITMLCGALGEIAKRVGLANGRYVRALDNVVHGAPAPARLDAGAMPQLLTVSGLHAGGCCLQGSAALRCAWQLVCR